MTGRFMQKLTCSRLFFMQVNISNKIYDVKSEEKVKKRTNHDKK